MSEIAHSLALSSTPETIFAPAGRSITHINVSGLEGIPGHETIEWQWVTYEGQAVYVPVPTAYSGILSMPGSIVSLASTILLPQHTETQNPYEGPCPPTIDKLAANPIVKKTLDEAMSRAQSRKVEHGGWIYWKKGTGKIATNIKEPTIDPLNASGQPDGYYQIFLHNPPPPPKGWGIVETFHIHLENGVPAVTLILVLLIDTKFQGLSGLRMGKSIHTVITIEESGIRLYRHIANERPLMNVCLSCFFVALIFVQGCSAEKK